MERYIDVKIDPEFFRRMEDICKTSESGKARIEILQMRMIATGGTTTSANAATESKEAYHSSDEEHEHEEENKKKSKKKGSKSDETKQSTKKEIPKRKDDLQDLLAQVTGRSDIIDDQVEDEYVVVEQLAVRFVCFSLSLWYILPSFFAAF
jgi:uncharacterized protein with von Willebrand factor type A (vWA) domain